MTRTLCLFPDLHGIARGKLANRGIDRRMTIGFSPGVFAKDIYGRPHLFDEFVTPVGASDMKVDVQADDVRSLAGGDIFGAEGVVIGRARASDGAPHRFDLRTVLKEFISSSSVAGGISVGAELEFYLLDNDAALPADGQAYAFGGLAGKQACICSILDALDGAGIEWLDLSQENEIDQYEISLKHSGALEQADRVFLSRMIIRHVAARFGMRASFIAVNAPDQSPSNHHLHVSSPHVALDDLAIAVQGSLVPAFALYRPSHNSRYTRDIASFASSSPDVADGSRFAAVRVIRNERPGRVELRTPTSDANPYAVILAFAFAICERASIEIDPSAVLDFDMSSSLETFLESDLAERMFDAEGRRLYGKLKRAEVGSAADFRTFEAERAALLKVL